MKPSRQQNGEVKRDERERIRQNGKFGRSKQPIVPFVGESAPQQVIKFNFTREEMMTKEEIEKLKVVDCLRDRLLPTEREVADDTIQVTGKHADLLVLSAPYPNSDDEDAVRPADSEYIMADIVGNFNKLSLDTRSLFSMRHSTQIRPQEGLSKERYIQWRINQYKEKRSDIRDAMENHSLSLIPINYHSHGPYETTALSLRPFVGAATAFRQRSDPATESNLHDHSVQICSHIYDYRRVHSILPKTYHRILPEYLINCPCLRMSYGADCDCQQLVEVATYKLHNVMLKIAGGVPPDMSLFEKTTGLETNVDEIVQQGQAGDPHSPGLLLGIDHERYIIPKSDWLPDVEKLTVHEAAVLNYMMNHWLKSNRTEKWWDMMANLLRRVYLSTLHHAAIRPALMSVFNTEHQCEQCEFCCCEQKSILAISRIGQYRAPFDANAAQKTVEKREEKKKKKIPS